MSPIFACAPRRHALLVLASLLSACNLPVYQQYTTGDTAGTGSSSTGGSDGTSTGGSTGATTGPGTGTTTTGTLTTGTATTESISTSTSTSTTDEPSTGDTSTGSSTTGDTSTGSSTTGGDDLGKMEKWGHPCATDDDCVAIVGAGGVCLKDVLGLYGLPGGYCTKTCALPDFNTKYVPDHATCGPGVHCIGVMGFFEACVVQCTDDSECPREGYECRILPEIGMAGDPMFCLMTDAHKL